MRAPRRRSLTVILAFALVAPALTARGAAPQSGDELLSSKGASARLVGPRREPVPVLNEGGTPLQLTAVDTAGGQLTASAWRSDSPEVARVDARGRVSPERTGFATVSAETPAGKAKCFVAVMKVSSQTGGLVRGDTKSDTSGTLYLSDPVHHVIVRAAGLESERWVGTVDRAGFADGQGAAARFAQPSGLAVDLSSQGGLYVADTANSGGLSISDK